MEECPFDGETPIARPAKPPPKPVVQSQTEIERIANTPMGSISFKDFTSLKSGRDQFSKMKLDQLEAAIDGLEVSSLHAEFGDDLQAEASCIRWMLRGLPIDKAIRKIRTDAEVAANARPK